MIKAIDLVGKMNLGARANIAQQQFSTEPKNNSKIQTEVLINQLFIQIKEICPAWSSAWPTQELTDGAKRQWLSGFIENGISDWSKIELGLKKLKLRESPFVPSVGEFIALYKPSAADLGLLNVNEAYAIAARLSHPTAQIRNSPPEVYHTLVKIGKSRLGQLDEKSAKNLFAAAYLDTVNFVAGGGQLTRAPVAELPKPEPEICHETRLKKIAELKKMMGV